MKRFLCVRLPSWPLQRLVVAQPALKGRAILLHDRVPRRGQQVVACSQAAHRAGVRPGMPLAEATAIDPEATLLPYDRQADTDTLQGLAQWCAQFSPIVGVGQPETRGDGATCLSTASDHLLLDATGVAAHLGGEQAMARQIAEAFEQRGYRVRVALASTLGAAWAMARYATQTPPNPETPAIVELPAGSTYLVVPAAAMWATLRVLPVRALRVPSHTVALLEELGLVQLGQLASVPRAALSARFGDLLLKRWDQLLGLSSELLVAHQAPPVFQAHRSLEHPTGQQRVLVALLAELLREIIQDLAAQHAGVLELMCRFRCPASSVMSDHSPTRPPGTGVLEPVSLRVGLFQPTSSAEHLTQLVQMQLAQLVLPGPVEHVAVEASLTAPLASRQGALFLDGAQRASRHLGPLVDRLASRLGPAAVVRPQLEVDIQPEHAYRYVPLTSPGRASGPVHRPARHTPHDPHRIRPLHLRSPPLPLAVVAVIPDGPPIRFHFQQRSYGVARYWGPERLETGWWRGRSVRRDYYRLETEGGQWFWIFRQLDDGQWFLHGLFG